MFNKFVLFNIFTIIGYLLFSSSDADEKCGVFMSSANRYVDFLSKYGSSNSDSCIDDIKYLFAPNFKKTINGQVFFETQESYLEKIAAVRQWTGAWNIKVLDIVESDKNRNSAICYLCIVKEGTYITVAILHYDINNLITEISTIYHKYENGTQKDWFQN